MDKAEEFAEVAEVEANEEGPDTEGAGEMQGEEGEQELDLVEVQQERKEELEYLMCKSDVERWQRHNHDEVGRPNEKGR